MKRLGHRDQAEVAVRKCGPLGGLHRVANTVISGGIRDLLSGNIRGNHFAKPFGERHRSLSGAGAAIPSPGRIPTKADEVLEEFARVARPGGRVFIGFDAEELMGVDHHRSDRSSQRLEIQATHRRLCGWSTERVQIDGILTHQQALALSPGEIPRLRGAAMADLLYVDG